jgi:hypothetical protein
LSKLINVKEEKKYLRNFWIPNKPQAAFLGFLAVSFPMIYFSLGVLTAEGGITFGLTQDNFYWFYVYAVEDSYLDRYTYHLIVPRIKNLFKALQT